MPGLVLKLPLVSAHETVLDVILCVLWFKWFFEGDLLCVADLTNTFTVPSFILLLLGDIASNTTCL